MRIFWPVTLAAALLVGLLAYGVFSKGGDTTLDEAVAKGERPIAPVAALPALGADGNVSLADYRGKVVVLNVWASWCEPCREEMPSLERLKARLDGQPFDVLAVNYGEGEPRIAGFLEKQKLSLTVLLDSRKEAASAWKAGGLPMTFLVDARGRVRYSGFGERDWSTGEGLQLVERLVAEARGTR